VAGALVALNAKIREPGVVALALAAGLLHGLVNGATMGATGASGLALAGAVTTVFVVTALVAAEVTALPAGWPRIAVRVGGSWIAAAGLLMLGWLARGS
jgi:hydrogenase/urease accessory protein HupE